MMPGLGVAIAVVTLGLYTYAKKEQDVICAAGSPAYSNAMEVRVFE
jgi:hypothetical protein